MERNTTTNLPAEVLDTPISKLDVQNRHPLYQIYAPRWDVSRRCYMGGYDFRPIISPSQDKPESISFLRRHKKETNIDFIGRHNGSYSVNHIRKIYNRYAMYIFGSKAEIRRQFDPSDADYFEPYIENIDSNGTHISTFMEKIFLYCLSFGLCYGISDRTYIPNLGGNQMTQGKLKSLNARAWIHLITPLQLVNWSRCPLTGEFQWILIETKEYLPHKIEEPSNQVSVFIYIDSKYVIKFNHDKKIFSDYPREHGFGKVPIQMFYLWDYDLQDFPEPFSIDLQDLQIEIYNLISSKQEEYDNATFPIFMIPRKELTAVQEKTEELRRKDEDIVTGIGRALRIDPESKILPQWISNPTETLAFKQEEIRLLIEQMDEIAEERASQIANTSGVISGISIHQQLNKKFMFIAYMAFLLQRQEQSIWDTIRRWDFMDDEKAPQIQSIYPTKFDTYDSAEARANLQYINEAIPSNTAKIEACITWIKEALPSLQPEKLEIISNELEENLKVDNQKQQDLAAIYAKAKMIRQEPEEPETEEEEALFKTEEAN